jgi:hypothetical protein
LFKYFIFPKIRVPSSEAVGRTNTVGHCSRAVREEGLVKARSIAENSDGREWLLKFVPGTLPASTAPVGHIQRSVANVKIVIPYFRPQEVSAEAFPFPEILSKVSAESNRSELYEGS